MQPHHLHRSVSPPILLWSCGPEFIPCRDCQHWRVAEPLGGSTCLFLYETITLVVLVLNRQKQQKTFSWKGSCFSRWNKSIRITLGNVTVSTFSKYMDRNEKNDSVLYFKGGLHKSVVSPSYSSRVLGIPFQKWNSSTHSYSSLTKIKHVSVAPW